MNDFAKAEKAFAAALNQVESGTKAAQRTDYRELLIEFADEVPGRQKAVIKRMPLEKVNNLIAVLNEFKEEARQQRIIEIANMMSEDGIDPAELV
ncbi:hypothetical protein L0B53_01810 [Vibrio sp. SS-MA-C1-2]|uniref:hypothetical protein n=1 Tax=Vibrio sp. SS-MA-C1-2 TaxID=2908646 RepID=UPI001F3EA684|nr:hypothetical protein [Vibrio sp. SS-MA-C1-2]UJF17531.1 hypothetical protein L0B53_01810 [Vibrio sp. SS-MA-C1-2]